MAVLLIFWMLISICGCGDAYCRTHSDCSGSLATLNTERTYCCGASFCCTFEQYSQGLTTDPFQSMGIGGIVGIVVGILAFFSALGIFIWCMFKDSGKRRLRPPKKRSSARSDSRPGYAISTVSGSRFHGFPHKNDFRGHDNFGYATSKFDSVDDNTFRHDKRVQESRYNRYAEPYEPHQGQQKRTHKHNEYDYPPEEDYYYGQRRERSYAPRPHRIEEYHTRQGGRDRRYRYDDARDREYYYSRDRRR